MTIMSKVVEQVTQNLTWEASTRIGVPIILALILTGIPAHLFWASGINRDVALAQAAISSAKDDIRALEMLSKEDSRTTTAVRIEVGEIKRDVAAVLRSLQRMEARDDANRRP